MGVVEGRGPPGAAMRPEDPNIVGSSMVVAPNGCGNTCSSNFDASPHGGPAAGGMKTSSVGLFSQAGTNGSPWSVSCGNVTVWISSPAVYCHCTLSPGRTCTLRGSISSSSTLPAVTPALNVTSLVPSGCRSTCLWFAARSTAKAPTLSWANCALAKCCTCRGVVTRWLSATTCTEPDMPRWMRQMKVTVDPAAASTWTSK